MKEWIHSHEKAAYRVVAAALLVCMVLLGAENFLGIHRLSTAHFIVAFTVIGVLTGVCYMTVRGRILCLSALFILSCAWTAAGPAGNLDFWRHFFRWLMGQEEAVREWEAVFGLLQTAMLAAVCYPLQILFEKLPKLKEWTAVALLLILAFCLVTRREWNHFGMALVLCFFLLAWVERVQKRWEKRRMAGNGIQAHTFWIFPFVGLYLLLMMIAPAPEKPYDWAWAKAIYFQVRESFRTYAQRIKWDDREGFGMAFTGFSEEGTLGGDLQEETGEVMWVRVKPAAAEYLYLTGTVYDTFDGRGWSGSFRGNAGGTFLDTAQTLYAVRCYDERYQRDYLKEIQVTVRYEDFSTGYVFAPLKTWGMAEKSGAAAEIDSGDGTLRWDGQRGYGTEYELRCFAMNIGQPQFDAFVEEAVRAAGSGRPEETGRAVEPSNQAVWEEVRRECERHSGQSYFFQDLADYESAVCENYLDEVHLSGELEGLLKDIVGDAETDLEKLQAIEGYLSALNYTLVPGRLPKSVGNAGEFLDYFLVESRQGYCTYFATAFVLLARAEGIPARYVQGYCVPVGEQGEAVVASHMAHAWPEAYLKGVGWIPFEPTPGYGNYRYDPWRLQQPADVTAESLEIRQQGTASGEDGMEEPGDSGEMEGMESVDPESGEDGDPAYSRRLFGPAASAVLLLCGALPALDHMWGKRRYGKKSPQERLRTEVLLNLEVLALLVPERESWETLEEFREKAGGMGGRQKGQGKPEEQGQQKGRGKPEEQGQQKGQGNPEEQGRQEEQRKPEEQGRQKGQGRPEEQRKPGEQGRQEGQDEERKLPLRFTEDYEEVIYGRRAAGEEMVTNAVKEREELLELLKQERRWGWLCCKIRLYFGRYRF